MQMSLLRKLRTKAKAHVNHIVLRQNVNFQGSAQYSQKHPQKEVDQYTTTKKLSPSFPIMVRE